MNERFKFRCWAKKEKVMHYDAEETYNGIFGKPKIEHTSFSGLLNDKDYVVMQYTGLKDINGKLIYEGDILRFYAQSIIDAMAREPLKERIGVAVWNEEELKFDVLVNGKAVPDLCKETDDNNFEIIGNIYENKELLEEAE